MQSRRYKAKLLNLVEKCIASFSKENKILLKAFKQIWKYFKQSKSRWYNNNKTIKQNINFDGTIIIGKYFYIIIGT